MVEFNVGDTALLENQITGRIIGGYSSMTIPAGTLGEISKVSRDTVYFRTNRIGGYAWESEKVSIPVFKSYLKKIDPNDPNAPRPPRPLGQAPDDVPDVISPDHPGLQWLWDDAGQLAKDMGHCATYDSMCDRLGIPGRKRSISVKMNLNGIEISTKVEARSKKEAEEIVKGKLQPVPVESEKSADE